MISAVGSRVAGVAAATPVFFFKRKVHEYSKKSEKTVFRINFLVVVIKMDFFGMQINQVHLIEAFSTNY